MAKFGWVAALFVGYVLCGAALVGYILTFDPRFTHRNDRDLSNAAGLSDAELARVLMDRVAPTFVASARQGAATSGVGFFTAPLPYGDNLCRLDILSFPAKIVRGRPARGDSRWDDNLALTRAYGVWTRNAPKGETRDTACAKYRDFQHLISGDGVSIDRVVNVLMKARAALAAGRADFHVGCTAPDGGRVISCKVSKAAILKLDVSDFNSVEAKSEQVGKTTSTYVDELTTRAHPDSQGCFDFSIVRIESRQTVETEGAENPDLVDLEYLPGGPVC